VTSKRKKVQVDTSILMGWTTCSRPKDKIHLQVRMLAHASLFWCWLEDRASVCARGDAALMARDARAALHRIAE
jgi:sulfite reductase alpha subunit-like flavoprotein